MRLIAVVLGTRSEEARARETQKLLADGFRYFETRKIYDANKELKTVRVWKGEEDSFEAGFGTKPQCEPASRHQRRLRSQRDGERADYRSIKAGQELGQLTLKLNGEVVAQKPLVALAEVKEAGFFGRTLIASDCFSRKSLVRGLKSLQLRLSMCFV